MKNLVIVIIFIFHLSDVNSQPSKQELIRDMLPLEETGKSIATSILMFHPHFSGYPALPDDQQELILQELIENGSRILADSISRIYDSLFTEEEIRQLYQVFSSSPGSGYRDLLPVITGRSVLAVYQWYLANQAELGSMIDSVLRLSSRDKKEEFHYEESVPEHGNPYRYRKRANSKSVYPGPGERYKIFYNNKKWEISDHLRINPSADVAFKLKDRDVYAVLVSEDDDLNMQELRYAAVYNLYKASDRYELIHDELRQVNGEEILSMEFRALINFAEFRYHNYYFTRQNRVIQFSGFAGSGSFETAGKDIEELLNGLVIKK